jgi:hypothetical protein
VQVALPLAYYAGLRAPSDERFAWRMFSAVRLDRCKATVTVEGAAPAAPRALPLDRVLQHGWVNQLERGQPRVVEGALARACVEPGAVSATLERRCVGEAQTVVRECPQRP